MSEEIKEDDAPEKETKEESGNETDSAEKENKPEPVKSKNKSGKKKWIFLILIIALLGLTGLGLIFMSENFSLLLKNNDFQYSEISINEDNLSEESLSPFFIPPGPEAKTIRIDLTIVWDALASIRYKEKELGIRNMIYEKFYENAQLHEDLNEQTSYLENEISSMLRKTLGVQNLVVRIREIRYF